MQRHNIIAPTNMQQKIHYKPLHNDISQHQSLVKVNMNRYAFFATVTMAVNSPEPTLFCVITLFVWLSSLYDQDVPSLEFFVYFVVVVIVAFIVVGKGISGRDR